MSKRATTEVATLKKALSEAEDKAANVGFRVPADPQGSNSGVHAEITPPADPCLAASQGSKLHEEQHRGHEVYTGSGHPCGVIPYSSLWCVDCLGG